MATRFVHVLLCMEQLEKIKIDEKAKAFFLLGNIYPDLPENKKKSHFETYRLFFPYYDLVTLTKLITDSKKKADRFFYLGWKSHLMVDNIWQATMIQNRFFLICWWYIYYNKKINSMYYQELSYMDILLRDSLEDAKRTYLENEVIKMVKVHQNSVPVTKNKLFDNFIDNYVKDFRKKDPPPIVHLATPEILNEFYRKAGQNINVLLQLYI